MKSILLIILVTLAIESRAQLVRPYTPHRQIFFEGNSLFNNISGANVAGGNFVTMTAQTTLVALPKTFAAHHYAIGGQTQAQINSAFSTRISPYFRSNDIYVIWEGRNDMRVNGLTGAQAFANLQTCITNIKGLGGKVVVCTIAKSNYTGGGEPADLVNYINTYNALVRAISDPDVSVADIGADSHFDDVADADNTTYYLSDKLHMNTTGQTLAASIVSTAIALLL